MLWIYFLRTGIRYGRQLIFPEWSTHHPQCCGQKDQQQEQGKIGIFILFFICGMEDTITKKTFSTENRNGCPTMENGGNKY